MKLKSITEALTQYITKKNPSLNGFFLGRESIESTNIGVYKNYKVDIYFHITGKNHLVFTFSTIKKSLKGHEENLKEECSALLLEQILTNLASIENEAVSVRGV